MFFIADLCFTINEIAIASYADGNNPYAIANNVDDLITNLEQASNLLRRNADKCHLLVSTNDRVSMHIDGSEIDKSDTEKLLDVRFDRKLSFEDHISDICKKACKIANFNAPISGYTFFFNSC